MNAHISNAQWSIGKRESIAMVMGILLYAGITSITSFANLGEAIGGDIRPAIVIPIFFGFVFGPIVGFVVGAGGNFLYDAYAGWLQFPLTPSTGNLFADVTIGLLLNWEIGNGLIGFVPGLRALYHRRYFTWQEQLWAIAFLAVGIVGGVGFAAFTDIFLYSNADLNMFVTQFVPIVRVNLLNAILLVPLLLFNYARLDWENRQWLHSRLLYRFLLAIVVSAALPTALLSIFLSNQATGATSGASSLTFQLGLTIFLTVLFTLVNALLLAQSILRPLITLTEAAHAMLENRFTSEEAAAFQTNLTEKSELSYLQEIFGRMAEEVLAREERLRKQVDELQILIDDSRRDEEVTEITESEFFQSLRERATAMRARRKRLGNQEDTIHQMAGSDKVESRDLEVVLSA